MVKQIQRVVIEWFSNDRVLKPMTTGLRVRWVDHSATLPSSHNVDIAKLTYSLIKSVRNKGR